MTPTLALPSWILRPDQVAEHDRILAGKYFLVRMAGFGEIWRCKRCNGRHTYLTLNCIDQPFSGLTGGIFAYYKTAGMAGALQYMDPAQRARYDKMAVLFDDVPDLSTSHPEWARKIATPERDIDRGVIALGILTPINRKEALARARAINMRGIKPRFTLPGLEREL